MELKSALLVSQSFNIRVDTFTVLPFAAPPINSCGLRIADNWAWAHDWRAPTLGTSLSECLLK